MRIDEEERTTESRDKRLKRLLVSMRSMDDSRSQDTFSSTAGGGCSNKHTRPRSPAGYDDYDHRPRQRQRQRQGDSSTDEIIRFVRGYQVDREPTLLRLQKKAPLPGIGQVSHSLQEESSFVSQHHDRRHSHTDFDDEDEDDDEDDNGNPEDDLLDNEVAAIDAEQRSDPLRSAGVFEELSFNPPSSSFKVTQGRKRQDRHSVPSTAYSPPVASHFRHVVRPLDAHGGPPLGARPAHARKGLGRPLKQLPPIAREDLPERPSAPSPSLTPPGEDEEELDSAGEPVDFIDAP